MATIETKKAEAKRKNSLQQNVPGWIVLAVLLGVVVVAGWQITAFLEKTRTSIAQNPIGRPLSEVNPELFKKQMEEEGKRLAEDRAWLAQQQREGRMVDFADPEQFKKVAEEHRNAKP